MEVFSIGNCGDEFSRMQSGVFCMFSYCYDIYNVDYIATV